MSGNCKDCRHWEHKNYGRDGQAHECSAVDDDAQTGELKDANFALYAEALDDSGLSYGLKTGPMFGCVQFQRKG
jgi:hypothetical protein